MAGEVGLEPTTYRLTADCANQLRYSPILFVTKNVYLVVPTGFEPASYDLSTQSVDIHHVLNCLYLM